MAHVDYEEWAQYVHRLLWQYHPHEPETVVELGCGTGLFALDFQVLGDYQMLGLDNAPNMIRFARERAEWEQVPIQFEVGDFTNFRLDQQVDAMIMVQDGLNYCLETQQVEDLLRCAMNGLKPGGLFIFDQSTPWNSINNAAYFDYEDEEAGFHYIRRSAYDADSRLHTTRFKIDYEQGEWQEEHVQKAYTKAEIEALIAQSGLVLKMAFEDMTLKPASDASERIHWIVQKPA